MAACWMMCVCAAVRCASNVDQVQSVPDDVSSLHDYCSQPLKPGGVCSEACFSLLTAPLLTAHLSLLLGSGYSS